MHEINVTPFVDVMLVLLIIFMVTAPMLTVGVPIELPESKGQQLQAAKEPLVISVDKEGRIFIQETEVKLDELVPKLRAIAKAGANEQIFFRGFKGADYQQVARLMDHIKGGGFHKIGLVTAGDK
jgi:biopolymer transport protein TolR